MLSFSLNRAVAMLYFIVVSKGFEPLTLFLTQPLQLGYRLPISTTHNANI